MRNILLKIRNFYRCEIKTFKRILRLNNMNKKSNNLKNTGNWIGIGTAIGVAVFAATKEPTWIAVGVAVGAALAWKKPKN